MCECVCVCLVFPLPVWQLEWSSGCPLPAAWPEPVTGPLWPSVLRGVGTHGGRCSEVPPGVIFIMKTCFTSHWELPGLPRSPSAQAPCLCKIFFYFGLGHSWFTVLLVSGIQQSDWVIYVHVSILFPFRLLQNTDLSLNPFSPSSYRLIQSFLPGIHTFWTLS